MGANAQTSVPTFVSGQVLTSAQQNLINTGVPVAAGTAERDGLFGGSGEKTLAEGQLVYVESLDVVQYYDGSSWATIQSGLNLVAAGSFSAVSTVNIDNVFTSSYRNYLVVIEITATTGAAGQIISSQLRTGGTAATGSDYYFARSGYNWTSGVINADVGNGITYWFIPRSNGSGSIGGASSSAFTITSPNLAAPTWFTGTSVDGSYAAVIGGYHSLSTAYDGFSLNTTTGGTNITGVYRIYGLKD